LRIAIVDGWDTQDLTVFLHEEQELIFDRRIGRRATGALVICVAVVGLAAGMANGQSTNKPAGDHAVSPAWPESRPGWIRYVGPKGSDRNPGTKEWPFASLAKFSSVAKPGDTCYIRGGTYLGRLPNGKTREEWIRLCPMTSGTAGKWITVQNYPGEKVIIDLNVPGSDLKFIDLSLGNAYLKFKGLTFRNFCSAFNCTDASGRPPHDIDFEDLDCGYAGDYKGVKEDGKPIRLCGTGTRNINIRRCKFHHCAGPGIVGIGGVSDILIEDCDSHDNDDGRGDEGSADGFTFTHRIEGGTEPKIAYPSRITFRRCRAWNCTDDGIDVKGDQIRYEDCQVWNVKHCCYKAWSVPGDKSLPGVQGHFVVQNCTGHSAGEVVFKCFGLPDIELSGCVFIGTDESTLKEGRGGEVTFLYRSGRGPETWQGKLKMRNCTLLHLGKTASAVACEINMKQMATLELDHNIYHNVNRPKQAFVLQDKTAGKSVAYGNADIDAGKLFANERLDEHGDGRLPARYDAKWLEAARVGIRKGVADGEATSQPSEKDKPAVSSSRPAATGPAASDHKN